MNIKNLFKRKEKIEKVFIENDSVITSFSTIGHEKLKELKVGEEFKEMDLQGKEKIKRIIGKEEIKGCLIVKSIEVV